MNIQKIFLGIAFYNSVMFGAQNGALAQIHHQQPIVTSMNGTNATLTTAYPIGNISSNASTASHEPQKFGSQKLADDSVHHRKILEVAAEKELMAREQKAKPMSEYITQKYIGEDDSWAFVNQLTTQMGFSDSWHSKDSATRTLTEIYHYFKPSAWTQETIFDLFYTNSKSYNSRLANLLNNLMAIKRKKYYVVPLGMEPCSAHLKGSTIDDFFDETFLFPGLPSPFQQFIQRQIEEEFPRMCMLDKPELSQAHPTTFLILLTALHHCGDDTEEIKSFFTSAAFKKHEKNTDFALTNYIKENRNEGNFWCSWFGVHCKK